MKPLFAFLGALVILAGSSPAEKTGAEVRIVPGVTAVQPGVPFTVALHVQPARNFHTYWRYPGIVGLPTSVKWALPEGFQAGNISWPTPKIVDMASHPAHGFHRELLLPIVITPPAEITGESVTLTGQLSWMACHRECYPGFAKRELTLPVNRLGKAKPHPRWAPAIAREQSNLPRESSLWTVTVESLPDTSPILVRLRATPQSNADPGKIYFFSEDGQITSEPPQDITRHKDGSYLITGTRSEFSPKDRLTLPGTLIASKSWNRAGTLPAIRAQPAYPTREEFFKLGRARMIFNASRAREELIAMRKQFQTAHEERAAQQAFNKKLATIPDPEERERMLKKHSKAMRVARADPATRRTPASRSLERKLNALVQIQDLWLQVDPARTNESHQQTASTLRERLLQLTDGHAAMKDEDFLQSFEKLRTEVRELDRSGALRER